MKKISGVILTVVFFVTLDVGKSVAQKSLFTGIAITVDEVTDDDINSYLVPGAGITYDFRATRHSGIEGGIFYRTYITGLFFFAGTDRYSLSISERHISVPVLYKFRSKIVNLAAGPDFDFYVGWKQRFKAGAPVVNSFSINKTFFLGALFKISKQIGLSQKILLEPEFHFIPIVNTDYRAYLGFTVHVRYRVKGEVR